MRQRANAKCSERDGAVGPKNIKMLAALLACLSATLSGAAGAGTGNTICGQTSCGGFFECFGGCAGVRRFRLWFGFVYEAQRRAVQFAQLNFARLVTGEFYKVAAFQKFSETLLLVRQQEFCLLKLMQEFFRRSLGRAEIETFFEVVPDCV